MRKTLKRETARPPEKDDPAQQLRFDAWRDEFNSERPHEALGQKTPALLYRASLRPLSLQLPEPDYPGHFQVRLVSKSSMFRLHHRPLFISEALIGEYIGLEEIDDGVWSLCFYDALLGRPDERNYKVRG